MYVPRLLRSTFELAIAQFPAVLVTGPRQSGKTTFLRHRASDCAYVSFDDPVMRQLAASDPNTILDQANPSIILDEIQLAPGLLSHIKMRIDADRQSYGRWWMTGSQQFGLMQGVSETLAGRVAVLDLLPFALAECAGPTLEDIVWAGAYPDPALRPETRDLWATSYLRTYIERDVRQVRDIQDLRRFEDFLALVSARHGAEWNASKLSREVGASVPSIQSWLSVLAASFFVYLLPSWHRNLGKRVVKAPKVYLMDSALVCTLTRQPSGAAALAGPMGGTLFEGLIIGEALKRFAAAGKPPGVSYWRSRDGLEVDLIIESSKGLFPVEVKKTATPSLKHAEPLKRWMKLVGDEATAGVVVCNTAKRVPLGSGIEAIPWREWSDWLESVVGL